MPDEPSADAGVLSDDGLAPAQLDHDGRARPEPAESTPGGPGHGQLEGPGAPRPLKGPRHARVVERPTVSRGRTPVRELLVVFVVTGLLTLAWFRHAWAHPTGFQVGIPGDADEYDWFLAWVPWAIGHGINPLISTLVNAPKGANLMWNTSVILPGVVMAPFTVLFGPALSYNILITFAPALDCAFAYWAFRRWCGRLPSLVGALVFAFCPFVAAQSPGHLAQVLLMSVPLFLIVLDRLLVVQSGRAWLDGLMLGVLAWAQLLTGEELLAMEASVAVVAVVIIAWVNWHSVPAKRAYALPGLGVGAVVFVVLSAPFLGYQYLGPYKVQSPHPWNTYVTDLLNFFVPTNITQLAPAWAINISAHFVQGEDGSYLGIPVIALAVFAMVVGRRRGVVWAAATIGLVAAVFSMGPTLHIYGHNSHVPLPDDLLQRLPAMKNLLPARFASVTALGAGFLVALGLSELSRRHWAQKAGGWAMAVAALALICPIANYPATLALKYPAFATGWACPKPAGGAANKAKPPVALVMPTGNEVDLLWQAEANFCFAMPTSTGMTGTHPITKAVPYVLSISDGGPNPPAITPQIRQKFATVLQADHVSEVIVTPENPASPTWSPPGQAQLVVWLEAMLGGPPAQYREMYFAYSWKVPPYHEVATGDFSSH